MKSWRIVSSAVSVLVLLYGLQMLVQSAIGIPFYDQGGTTLMLDNKESQIATASALAKAIGMPGATLNTDRIERFLFSDGTSVDYLNVGPFFNPRYKIVALKQIVLPYWSFKKPIDIAEVMKQQPKLKEWGVWVDTQPDQAFPDGDIVIVTSNAFRYVSNTADCRYGFAILIRKHALHLGGPRPVPFHGF